MYQVFDLETQTHQEFKRKASQFCQKNYIVARGWKVEGDKVCSWEYFPEFNRTSKLRIAPGVTILVGFNIKFDIMWELAQGNVELLHWLMAGGEIWDCQYAEYLINGQTPESQMCSLNDTAPKYGGTEKIDAVKALWEQGVQTSDIPEDLLLDYLVGTEEEKRNGGDIGNTELMYLGHIKKADELGMRRAMKDRMDGLLATTFMEFFGLKVDVATGAKQLQELTVKLKAAEQELSEFIPKDLPFEFNWGSRVHSSCLIFGGTVKYKKSDTYIDEATGELARYKSSESWPVFNGTAIDLRKHSELLTLGDDGLWRVRANGRVQDRFVSGAKKGTGKFKKVAVPGELKTKIQEFLYDLPGYTKPEPEWATKNTDGRGKPLYSTGSETMDVLLTRKDILFIEVFGRKTALDKEIGTYYVRYDEKKKEFSGMMTCVRTDTHIINHKLNHNATVTTRLSSSDPNLQNLPRGDKSLVKRMFISRFGEDGMMIEADYSQLEVVVQGVLSKDKNLCQDLRNKIDFHCKRVSAKFGCTYEEALVWCKDENFPEFKLWKSRRTGVKEFSFQRAYGAGAEAIANATGLDIDDVRALIEAEEALYPEIVTFNANVESEVQRNTVPFQAPVPKLFNADGSQVWRNYRRGTYQSPTGTIYSFRTHDAPAFLQKRGIRDSFSPPELKNYPVQGTGGEFVQMVLGLIIRHFLKNNFYGGKAFPVNTVHDCIWFDCHKDVYEQVARDIKPIMESIPQHYNEHYGMSIDVPFPVEVEVGPNMYDLKHFH